MDLKEILYGSLLGDSSVRVWRNKYFYYQHIAKDKNFLEWVKKVLGEFDLKTYITLNNKVSDVYMLGFYINNKCYPWLLDLRNKWYKQENGKTTKTIPRDLEITPTTLLFWYLGDGCLVRRKNDENRVPFIVLATNCFSKDDINILIEKLKELGLNFYPVEYTSGFNKGKKCGYCLYSKTEDGTPFRFFKLIGLECPQEIADYTTGAKGIYHEQKFFKNKWPTPEDWIKILSNIKEIGKIIRTKRNELNLTPKQLAQAINVSREHIRDIELGKHSSSIPVFRKILKVLNLDIPYLLKVLNTRNL